MMPETSELIVELLHRVLAGQRKIGEQLQRVEVTLARLEQNKRVPRSWLRQRYEA